MTFICNQSLHQQTIIFWLSSLKIYQRNSNVRKNWIENFILLLYNLVQFYFFSERSKDVSCRTSDVRSRFLEMSEFEKAVKETTDSDPNAFSWNDYRITLKSEEFRLWKIILNKFIAYLKLSFLNSLFKSFSSYFVLREISEITRLYFQISGIKNNRAISLCSKHCSYQPFYVRLLRFRNTRR